MPDPSPDAVSRKPTSYTVPPVERALRLLQYIGDGNQCHNLSVAARELSINRTTLLRLLHTLKANHMVEDIAGGSGYRLGTGLISLAARATHGREIVQVCRPFQVELTSTTGMSSHLGILDGTDVVYLSRETPETQLISNVRAGFRMPAYASAIGRAILAALPMKDIESLYENESLTAVTDKTPTTLQALRAQTDSDRMDSVVWSRGNFEINIGACAAVIFDHTGRPAGAINVSASVQQFSDPGDPNMLAVKNAVLKAAKQTSAALGFAESR